MLCPIKVNTNTIELIVHTSCYWGRRLTHCYNHRFDSGSKQPERLRIKLLVTKLFLLMRSPRPHLDIPF